MAASIPDDDFGWHHYWNISVPGLSMPEAESLLAVCEERYGKAGSTVDPRYWLTMHLDVDTAKALVEVLRSGPVVGRPPTVGVRESVEDWLTLRARLNIADEERVQRDLEAKWHRPDTGDRA